MNITDHAVIRWLERFHGFDIDAYRKEIEEQVRPFAEIKSRSACLGVGLYAALAYDARGCTVITIVPDKPTPNVKFVEGHQPEKLNWKALKRKRAHK